jgi:hypothetical protein
VHSFPGRVATIFKASLSQADQSHEYVDREREQTTLEQALLAPQEKMDARTCAHLLAKHIPEEIRILPSYLMPSWKLMELMLLLNK